MPKVYFKYQIIIAWLGALLLLGCAKQVLVQPVIDMSKYQRVAVLPFESDSFLSTVGQQLADEVVVNLLEKAPNLEVVERARIENLLQEQDMVKMGYMNPETIIQVGRLLGVRGIITGSVSLSIGDIYPTPVSPRRVATGTATMRLIDTETGKIVWATRERSEYSSYMVKEGSETSFSMRTDHEMMQEVVRELGRSLAKAFYPHYELQY